MESGREAAAPHRLCSPGARAAVLRQVRALPINRSLSSATLSRPGAPVTILSRRRNVPRGASPHLEGDALTLPVPRREGGARAERARGARARAEGEEAGARAAPAAVAWSPACAGTRLCWPRAGARAEWGGQSPAASSYISPP